MRKSASIVRVALPRTFAVFLNQNKNAIFAERAVRLSLDAAIDKERVIAEVLKGYGKALEGPIPPLQLGPSSLSIPVPLSHETQVSAVGSGFAERARLLLSEAGWKFDEENSVWKKSAKGGSASGGNITLEFNLATADQPELAATAELLATMWKEAGIKVSVHVYPLSELNSIVLRPRNYEGMLFGEVVGRSLDLFAFWHSSQRNDPGLNLALYTNSKADTLLTRAREEAERDKRLDLYADFEVIVREDSPAVFLFSPEFIYLVPTGLHGLSLGSLSDPAERFLNVYEWYVDTERVWNFFTTKTAEE